MPEINLLSQNQKASTMELGRFSSKLVSLLGFLVIVMVVGWMFLFYQNKATQNEIFNVQDEIKKQSEAIVSNPERTAVIKKQGQLKLYNELLANQQHWSDLLATDLAAVTLKTSSYQSLFGPGDGTLKLSVSVPTYNDFDKYMQVFKLPEVNKVFSDPKVISVSTTQKESNLSINFEILVKYDQAKFTGLKQGSGF